MLFQRILINNNIVYDTSLSNNLYKDIVLKRGMGAIASLTFTVEPGGVVPNALSDTIEVIVGTQDNGVITQKSVFLGYAFSFDKNIWNEVTIVCEDVSAMLNDVIFSELKLRKDYTNESKTTAYTDGTYRVDRSIVICYPTLAEQLTSIQSMINSQTSKSFTLEVRGANANTRKRAKLDFERGTGLELLQAIATNKNMNLLFEGTTIAFVPNNYTKGQATQTIRFGENLMDLTQNIDASPIATCIVPYGSYWKDSDYAQAGLVGEDWHRIDLSDLYGESGYNVIRIAYPLTSGNAYRYAISDSGKETTYGRRIITKTFDGVTNYNDLYAAALSYLNSLNGNRTVEISALDLSGTGDFEPYKTVDVSAVPQGIVIDDLRIVESEMHLGEPEKDTVTIGVNGSTVTNSLNQVSEQMATSITNVVRQNIIEQREGRESVTIPEEVIEGYFNPDDEIIYANFEGSSDGATKRFTNPVPQQFDVVYIGNIPSYYKDFRSWWSGGIYKGTLRKGGLFQSFSYKFSDTREETEPGWNGYTVECQDDSGNPFTVFAYKIYTTINITYGFENIQDGQWATVVYKDTTAPQYHNIGAIPMFINPTTGELTDIYESDNIGTTKVDVKHTCLVRTGSYYDEETQTTKYLYEWRDYNGRESGTKITASRDSGDTFTFPYIDSENVNYDYVNYAEQGLDVVNRDGIVYSNRYYTHDYRGLKVADVTTPNSWGRKPAEALDLSDRARGLYLFNGEKFVMQSGGINIDALSTFISKRIPKNVGAFSNDAGYITRFSQKLEYYYTKAQVLELIETARKNGFRSADVLPTPSEDTIGYIYLIPNEQQGENIKDEFITIQTGTNTYAWERVGSTTVDLTGFVKTIQLNGVTYAVQENTNNIILPEIPTEYITRSQVIEMFNVPLIDRIGVRLNVLNGEEINA